MNKIVIYIAACLLIVSCRSEFQKLSRSTDYNEKYEGALRYYEAEDYYHAMQLFEDLVSVYRGTDKAERINWCLADCYYKEHDFVSAAYYYRTFVSTFPNSDRNSEAQYMSAMSNYNESPSSLLDQKYTYTAIEEFQLYVNKYPTGSHLEDCNSRMSELRKKLEKKAYDNAKLYYDTENFKAAIIALKNCLTSYPDTDYREEILFLILKSSYKLASNSVEKKKQERYEATVGEYYSYIDEYPQGKYLKDAQDYLERSKKSISSKSN